MKRILLSSLFSFLMMLTLTAQEFIGSGNTNVSISASDQAGNGSADKILDGSGLLAKEYEAGRFLQQATLAYDDADITDLKDNDFVAWIDSQFIKPINNTLPNLDAIYTEAEALYFANGGTGNYFGPSDKHFNYAWWTTVIEADDQLRQRVAAALSEILVISGNSDLGGMGEGLAAYYDILLEHSFGNYRDLLFDVTMNPSMAYYLTSLNNPKTQGTIRPDENYAREIMQLFTIGLYELNNNGSYKLDGMGNEIPTYDQDDIKEFAKVFTGLKGGACDDDDPPGCTVAFGRWIGGISKRVPCVMHESQHETGIKYLLNNESTNGTGMVDINNAIDNLFEHDNVGPFIGRRLIQRLVKSNPSPDYINRVALAFNDNGSGVRGDMKAVIKQILLDPEARLASNINDPDNGMLKSPIIKFTHVVAAIDKDNPSGNYWNNGFDYSDGVSQHPMQSPTVFNFYLPDFIPNNELSGLYGPEFQIFNTRTSINWVNFVHKWSVNTVLFWDWEGNYTENVYTDLTTYEMDAAETEEYINKLDRLFTAGTLTDVTRNEIRTAIDGIPNNNYNRARMALFLVLMSPEYAVLR